MNVGVLSSATSWYFRDLDRAANARGHRVTLLGFQNMWSNLSKGSIEIHSAEQPWNDCDGVVVRSMPPGSLEQVIVRMDMLAQFERQGRIVLNPAKCLELAIDKYLSLAVLHNSGIPTPDTYVCQTADAALAALPGLGNDVVVKPLFGGEGRGITRVADPDIAYRVFRTLEQMQAVIYLQRYIAHNGFDVRALVLDGEVFGMKRCHSEDWRTNVSRGATTEPHQLTPKEQELALAAADVCNSRFIGVDLIAGQDERLYVLEVNAVPGWRALSRTLGVDIADRVVRLLENW